MRRSKRIVLVVLPALGLLWIGALWVFGSRDGFFTHDDAFSKGGLIETAASDLKQTVVSPHLEVPLRSGESVLWCSTFQLAWNEACSLAGQDLQFTNEHPMVGVLNKKSFTRQDLDAKSYVAIADFVGNNVFERIDRALRATFQGRATPRYVPPADLTPRPQDIVAYAYLFKHLEFPKPFERIEQPILFGTEELPCFGISEEYKAEHYELLDQFAILDYASEDRFVIELKTKSEGDRLILAKMEPEATLDATVRTVQRLAANPEPSPPQPGDVLKVPKLNFDVTRRYRELEGKLLLTNNPNVADDLLLLSALQNVRFQLDEKGVRLRSESHVSIGCAGGPLLPEAPRIMIFDKPFLMMLQRRDAETPYFALWVANPELLVR